jgi:hypothetical protein
MEVTVQRLEGPLAVVAARGEIDYNSASGLRATAL